MKKKINSFSKKFKEDGDKLDNKEIKKKKNEIKLQLKINKTFEEPEY